MEEEGRRRGLRLLLRWRGRGVEGEGRKKACVVMAARPRRRRRRRRRRKELCVGCILVLRVALAGVVYACKGGRWSRP